MKKLLYLLLFLSFGHAFELHAGFQLAGYFTDNMVLQRGQSITVWGTSDPDAKVKVTLGQQAAEAQTDSNGQWEVALPELPASGPFTLTASSGSETRSLKNVMIGDVWLLAGQSNMVLALQSTAEWPTVKTAGDFPNIRVCKLPGNFSFTPVETYSRDLRWEPLNSARVGYFSGVGYHFGRTIQPAIGIPVGLVQASAGGTQAEQWTPEAALRAALPDNPLLDARDKAQAKATAEPQAKINPMQAGACVLYNGTIHPLRYAKFAGVVWYQGEANTRSPRDYRPVLTTLIKSWRQIFEEPELPFVIIQLPGFGLPKDDGWMRVQEAQLITSHDLNLGLVVTVDQGSATTIHPPNKAEVGRRAGLSALQHVYGQQVEGTSPTPKSVTFSDDAATVEFTDFAGDLVVKGDSIQGFELAGSDHKFEPATAELQGRSVVIKATGVSHPKSLRYLWAPCPAAVTLFSSTGLPIGPFRTEDANGKPLWFATTPAAAP